MPNKELLRLIAGFRKFRERYVLPEDSIYNRVLSQGQSPKTLVISCSDSRVDPAILTSAAPGELFVVRNVANLVPPFESAGGYHGVSSAIEFAVANLKVENVIIVGHSQCGGINALMTPAQHKTSFVGQWMKIAEEARQNVLKIYSQADRATQIRHCEMLSILVSIKNLQTFPFVEEAVRERGLNILGMYFDIEQGQLFEFNPEANEFQVVEV